MLKNISSVISPDLLWLLASMGHGDDLVLVDRNFPAPPGCQTDLDGQAY